MLMDTWVVSTLALNICVHVFDLISSVFNSSGYIPRMYILLYTLPALLFTIFRHLSFKKFVKKCHTAHTKAG